ncbi:MAG: vanadium-dependent haloperoxidase [Acidobacteriota bacterium]
MTRHDDRPRFTRRGFLSGMAGAAGLAGLGGPGGPGMAEASTSGDLGRVGESFEVRRRAAEHARKRGMAALTANGDEERLPNRIACYSKGLPHGAGGEPDRKAYDVLLKALRSGDPEDFERIPLGGFVKLANPQAAFAYELIGPDGCQVELAPAPAFDSAAQAGELVELYWHALLRDVPFVEYGSHPLVRKAAEDLSHLSDFRGPKTPESLLRGGWSGAGAGDLAGPYVSQFLLKPIPFTPIRVEQKIRTAVPGLDFMTDWDEWLGIQNGKIAGVNRFDTQARYIRNGRDLGEYVHRDFTYQAFLGACLMALKLGTLADGGNPYKHSRTQSGFTTFGQPYLFYLIAVVTQTALKACWYQKWMVHRRLRPEEMGGRVEAHARKLAEYPLHADLLGSAAVEEVRSRFGSALLPQAYPEGCPTHPSYPAGHAVIAGACVTALKACLDESHELPETVVASADGLSLLPWQGPPLTVGGELDKLAGNIAYGRNFAGIHWRSDATEGLRLGEAVAIEVLEEMRFTGNELFAGFSLRRFDGTRVSVG